MPAAIILSACRTPLGRFQGALSHLSAPELGAIVAREAVRRASVPSLAVDEVILGNVLGAGVGQAPARQAALLAGLPNTVAALTVNKVCGSGLKAIMLAAQAIMAGQAELVVAGGMESMSRAPYLLPRQGPRFGDRTLLDAMLHDGLTCPFSGQSMGQIAEALAAADNISRSAQDAYALESHRRALAAYREALFQGEIVPVESQREGKSIVVEADEGPRGDISLERLTALRPTFDEQGTVTAGNSSIISDGAAAVVLASDAFVAAHGLRGIARVRAMATAGTAPEDLFIATVPALKLALQRAALGIADLQLLEINEAFAVQMLACMNRLQVNSERVNVHGGALALGHPIGASGARVVVTLLAAMQARNVSIGAAALCLGGGNAVAAIFEAL
jgi:acetyl-CoA C-acetyltransferase